MVVEGKGCMASSRLKNSMVMIWWAGKVLVQKWHSGIEGWLVWLWPRTRLLSRGWAMVVILAPERHNGIGFWIGLIVA